MHRILTLLIFIMLAGQASAQTCPPSYRFVDFGVEDRDGIIRRGGTIFRAFNAEGTRLLVLERTLCADVAELSKDGRALPIPVVTHIAIDPRIAALDVTELQLSAVDDPTAMAEANAAIHQAKVDQPQSVITRGPDFLCASVAGSDSQSCQVISPYGGSAPLVIYCQGQVCEMPVMARDNQLVITATWLWSATDNAALGPEVSAKIGRITEFLEEQI